MEPSEQSTQEPNLVRAQEIVQDVVLTPEQVAASMDVYAAYRDNADEAVKIGLYGHDLEVALNDPATTLFRSEAVEGVDVFMPLLVPLDKLEWYNLDLLRGEFGADKEFAYYAHPPIPEDEESKALISEAIKAKLDQGVIIVTDQYLSQIGIPNDLDVIEGLGDEYTSHGFFHGEENERVESDAQVFVGPIEFRDATGVHEGPSLYDVYQNAVQQGELPANLSNGVSLVDKVEGEEAARIWELYKPPFDELSEKHPALAGFDEASLADILADPSIYKLVNRVDGVISTLAIFMDDFSKCPWFNSSDYKKKYPDYFDTKNILMFPGIVTDTAMRGENYGAAVVDLATDLYNRRGSNVLLTFECTETSATYIPEIVESAIGGSGLGKITGINTPVSVTKYKVFQRKP